MLPRLRVGRSLAVQEHHADRPTRIQLRLEAFNASNQVRFNNPSGAINTANFGRITSAQDGPVIQLGIKYLC